MTPGSHSRLGQRTPPLSVLRRHPMRNSCTAVRMSVLRCVSGAAGPSGGPESWPGWWRNGVCLVPHPPWHCPHSPLLISLSILGCIFLNLPIPLHPHLLLSIRDASTFQQGRSSQISFLPCFPSGCLGNVFEFNFFN